MIWLAVLGCALGCYLLKLAGLSVPAKVLEHPMVEQLADLLPVVLLAGLIGVQVFASPHGNGLVIDARFAGLVVAFLLLLFRAPFLVVVIGAALTAALLRLL